MGVGSVLLLTVNKRTVVDPAVDVVRQAEMYGLTPGSNSACSAADDLLDHRATLPGKVAATWLARLTRTWGFRACAVACPRSLTGRLRTG